MNFGLTIEKLVLFGVIAAFIIGPDRLPMVAQSFGGFIRKAKNWTNDAKGKLKEELGDDINDVEWRKLDPRQYDPRRIIREALLDDAPPARNLATAGSAAAVGAMAMASAGSPAAGTVGGSSRAGGRVALDGISVGSTVQERLLLAGETPPYDDDAT